jgi:hypothetical protein
MDQGQGSVRGIRVFGLLLIAVLAICAIFAPGPANGRGGYGPGGGYPTPTRTAEPTATATATPPTTVTPPPPDRSAPLSTIRPGRGQTARSILKRGLVLTIACSEDCRHVTRLYVAKNVARKLRIKPKAKRRVLVGKKTTQLKGSVQQTIRVKLSKKAKQGVRRMKRRKVRKLKLSIAMTVTDASSNVRRINTSRTFKR